MPDVNHWRWPGQYIIVLLQLHNVLIGCCEWCLGHEMLTLCNNGNQLNRLPINHDFFLTYEVCDFAVLHYVGQRGLGC